MGTGEFNKHEKPVFLSLLPRFSQLQMLMIVVWNSADPFVWQRPDVRNQIPDLVFGQDLHAHAAGLGSGCLNHGRSPFYSGVSDGGSSCAPTTCRGIHLLLAV